jgi:hypothetical protein
VGRLIRRSLAPLAALAGTLAVGPIPTLPIPTSTTIPHVAPTTTSSPTSTTTTTVARRSTTSSSAPSSTTTTTALVPGPNGVLPSTAGPGVVPPDALALINSVVRSGPNNTGALLRALAPLEDYGLSPQDAAIVGMGHFPVAGYTTWSDDWWMPRFTPVFHLHQGNDLFAAMGTPLRAPEDGKVRFDNDPVGGMAAYVTLPDGTYFYMAHLSAFASDVPSGSAVKQGQVIGFVGDTGDAKGGPPHCHFELHPKGGPAVDPKALLDGWVADALAQVPALLASYQGAQSRALTGVSTIRRFDVQSGEFSAPSVPASSTTAWASSVSPAGSAVRAAQVTLDAVAGEIDWLDLARQAQEQAASWQRAQDAAYSIVSAFTPPAFQGIG